MAKAEIGFRHGAPENRDKTWEKIVSGRTYVFTKARQKGGSFIYNCRCHHESGSIIQDSSVGYHTDRDLEPEEVERRQQFIDFISSTR